MPGKVVNGLLGAAVLCAFACAAGGQESGETPEQVRERVILALNPANIEATAERTADFDALMGLAILDPAPTREKILQKAANAAPERASEVATIDLVQTPLSVAWGDALIETEPSNAFGYYTKAAAFARAGSGLDAIEMLRKGAQCERFEIHDTEFASYTLRALDALELEGAARLQALAQAGYRRPAVWQRLWYMPLEFVNCVRELPAAERGPAADLLISYAGHMLSRSEVRVARLAARNALASAYAIKFEAARAEGLPSAQSYHRLRQIVASHDWGFEDTRKIDRLRMAVGESFRPLSLERLIGQQGDMDEQSKAALARLDEERAELAKRFIEIASRNPDEVFGALLTDGAGPIYEADYPQLFDAAEAVLQKSDELKAKAEEASVVYANKQRFKQLGLALLMYSNDHEGAFAPDFDTLVQQGYFRDEKMLLSAKTGRTFTYVGNGMRDDDRPGYIIAYDPEPGPDGQVTALFVDGHVQTVPAAQLSELLKK